MPPAARVSFLGGRLASSFAPPHFRVQGWDPILIVSQIVALQSLHYLSLSLILPPLLSTFSNGMLLAYEGGAGNVAMLMDWREFIGLATGRYAAGVNAVGGGLVGLGLEGAKEGVQVTLSDLRNGVVRIVESDPMRGWVVALGWILASLLDVVWLYYLVRRPTHILDFSLTLVFNHLILTTYYASSFPSSLFFWSILAVSTVAQVVLAEQCCVARDMAEGFSLPDPSQVAGGHSPALFGNTPLVPQAGFRTKNDVELTPMATHSRSQSRASVGSDVHYERVAQQDVP